MASMRPNPASPSDDPPAIPLGVRVERKHAIGAPGQPGTIRVVAMRGDGVVELEGTAAMAGMAELLGEPEARVWVDLIAPTQAQALKVGEALSLHPLIVEDVLEGNQRAKIETTDGIVHIVLFHLSYGDAVVASELDIVLGEGFLLTVHNVDWDPRTGHHLANGVAPILAHGPDHLLWAIADDLIDGYFPFADRIGDAIDDVQDEVVRKATPDTVEQVFKLKRELIQVRRAISPVREVFNQLTNRDEQLIDDDEIVYFRDIYDHVIRLTDELDNYRELASVDARRLPDPGQQQPVGHHEAADRGDGHPGRDRCGRRDLRDERGRRGAQRRGGDRVLGGHRVRGRGRGRRSGRAAQDRLDLSRPGSTTMRRDPSPWGGGSGTMTASSRQRHR